MVRNFEAKDEGLPVMTKNDEKVGTIQTVRGDVAHVKPDENLSDSIRQRMGWSGGEDVYELRQNMVAEITDDAVRIED